MVAALIIALVVLVFCTIWAAKQMQDYISIRKMLLK
jgi:hypothetical protein